MTVDADINDVLNERQKTYGDFAVVARRAVGVMKTLGLPPDIVNANSVPIFAMTNIVIKLSRLANNPMHRDSWVDIIGYATLVLRDIDEGYKS